MNTLEYLSNYSVESLEAEFNGCVYKYLKADYYYNNTFFGGYYILDYTALAPGDNQWRILDDALYFLGFQKQILEDAFFMHEGDTRYNLYLIFLLPENYTVRNLTDKQNDFHYARKLFLTEKTFPDFICNLMPLKREAAKISILDDRKKMLKILSEHARTANFYSYEAFEEHVKLMKDVKKISFKQLQRLMMMDSALKETLNGEPAFENKARKMNKKAAKNKEYRVETIDSIIINNFRCFKKECSIPFRKVNLLFGDNGTGKTSILDAIELAITGTNQKSSLPVNSSESIRLFCKTPEDLIVELQSGQDNSASSELWYGISANDNVEFNKLFNQFNYFDTAWASAFAVEGEEKINTYQIQNYLGIDRIKKGEELLHEIYKNLIDIFSQDLCQAQNQKSNLQLSIFDKLFVKRSLNGNRKETRDVDKRIKEHLDNSQENFKTFQENIKELNISLENFMDRYVHIIEIIFRLLINSYEYKCLEVNNENEIVAIRKQSNEKVPMSRMSTGQKVCLALSFMFSMFLLNGDGPNFIMLDEPAANLDDLHMLNLLDVLRRLSMSGTQIFFTTANPDVAKLFRRKFSFLKEDFCIFQILESEADTKILMKCYDPMKESELWTNVIYE